MYPYVYICKYMRVIVTVERMVVMSFGVLFWVVLKWHKNMLSYTLTRISNFSMYQAKIVSKTHLLDLG
jgi:hypothetical protein